MEIVLIRHGKPGSAHSKPVNAVDYVKWIRAYDRSMVSDSSRPAETIKKFRDDYLVSSDLIRAIHSTEIYTQRAPDQISPVFREMEIPRYKLPFTLKPMTWVFLSRALWMLGRRGPFESYRKAKQRAELATNHLIEIAQIKNKLVLFGHGFTNLHIRRQLLARGWELQSKSNEYWGVSRLVFPNASD